MTRKFNSRVMTMIAAVLALWLGTAVHAAPPDVPAAGHGRYVVVLWMPGTLLPGQKHGDAPKKLAEPDLAAFDATLLSRRDNELVVDMPPGKARALRRHEAVMYVQRIWMGEDTAGWNESYPRRGFEVASQSDTDITWEAAYTYDAAGNIKTMGEHAFEYDGVDRVLSDKVSGATIESYTYDAFGNRISVTAGSVLVQTPADPSTNRLTAAAYDAAGNVTQTGNTLLKYDSLNMAVEVQGTGVTPRRFIYDADDERLGWMASNLQRWTVRDFAGRTLREFKSGALTHAWDWQHDYIYAEGTLIAGEQQEWGYEYTPEYRYGGDRHYHLDHLGSVRIVSNEQGRSVAEYSFAPFGVQQNQTFQEQDNRLDPNTIDTMRFAGHARDYYGAAPEYGGAYLDYMHARYYGPAVGRFMSVDPGKDWDLHQPQSWNMYAYARNNPVLLTDPDGRKAIVRRDGNNIYIDIPVRFSRDATPERIARFTAAVESQWSGTFGQYSVTTRVTRGGFFANRVRFDSAAGETNRSFVSGGRSATIYTYSDTTVQSAVDAHEAGHLMNHGDKYTDQPDGTSRPNPGWEGNIMATVPGQTEEKNVDEIVQKNRVRQQRQPTPEDDEKKEQQ